MFFVPIIPPENGKPTKRSTAIIVVVSGTILTIGAVLCLGFFFIDGLSPSIFSLILMVIVAFGMIVVLVLSFVSEDKTTTNFENNKPPYPKVIPKPISKPNYSWSFDDEEYDVRFCSSCGSEIDRYDRFCSTCGSRINSKT